MIFSTSKKEIYYLLSCLLKSFDIEIINNIYDRKKKLEDNTTLDWYISEGIRYKKYKEGLVINQMLFNPYHETYNLFKHHRNKIFYIKILIEVIQLDGFILIKKDNLYIVPPLKIYIKILNDYVKIYGIMEIYNKIFQYRLNLTDLAGNRCIRSIILINNKYEYSTIAIYNNEYINPVDRMPRLIGSE
jgi:hypothetical protein